MHGNPDILKKYLWLENNLVATADCHLEHHKEVKMDMTLTEIKRKESLFF